MIITVGAEKGGVSKTRLAIGIAALAARDGVDVVLLDTDLTGSAASWSRIRNEMGVTPSIPVLSLPASPIRELQNLSTKYDLIIVDIGAQNYRTMLECALVSDMVLVPCGNDQQEMESTLKVFAALDSRGDQHRNGKIPAHAVLTRVSNSPNAKSTVELKEFLSSEGVSVLESSIPYRTSWQNTGKTGRAVHELKGKDRSEKAIAEMQAVYDEILSIINQTAAA